MNHFLHASYSELGSFILSEDILCNDALTVLTRAGQKILVKVQRKCGEMLSN
jgi:hypothetical protein